MFWKATVPISEEMYETSGPVMKFVRCFGLFPIAVHRRGTNYYLQWSVTYAIYSYAFGIFTLVTAYKGFIDDMTIAREKSIRIKVSTDIFIDFSDMSAVMLVLICGIFITPFKYATFYKFVSSINAVDAIIPPTDLKSARRISIWTLSSLLSGIFIMVVLDTIMYINTAGERSGKRFIIQTYTPFYVAYQVLLVHDGLMWHLVYCILRRVKLLNAYLKLENFIVPPVPASMKRKEAEFYVTKFLSKIEDTDINLLAEILNGNRPIKTISYNYNKINDVKREFNTKNVPKKKVPMPKLIIAYGKICDAIENSNQLLGTTRMITIIGLLWSLIVIPYLLIVEVSGKRKNGLYIMMYTLWVLVHFGRLVLLAQPCYSCLEECQETKNRICELLSTAGIDEELKNQLRNFSVMLLHRKFEFTVNGMTSLDRSLVASLIGTISTYLVILLQFAHVQR